ncbi:MAG: hypothetical protein HOM25_08335 [Rhodospirillaceae bacterium]|jgi:hypothetical protein|nr:hypothetical protein [Rhodospirillaceae bacterium]MBT5667087.1 hypothetical protein [Rhodospirillaceae bacterium]
MKYFFPLVLAIFLSAPVLAQEEFPTFNVHGLIDLRAVQTDDQVGWLDDGLGKTRFGGKRGEGSRHTGALGDASLILRSRFNWSTGGYLHLKFDKDQKTPIDVAEAFVTVKPVSTSQWRFGFKIGSFLPPVSLENVDEAWQSPYTISWSAINSWIGEDIRTTGAEATGRYRYDGGGVTLGGALFFGNDLSGTILEKRGWALHDRLTTLSGNIPQPATSATFDSPGDIEPFKEVDDRPGFYLFTHGEDEDIGGEILITLYDNLADDAGTRRGHPAWRTRFAAAGFVYDLPHGIELLSQFMYGDTRRQLTGVNEFDVVYAAAYVMLSGFVDEDEIHRLSLRHDRFGIDERDAFARNSNEIGDAWTAAYSYRPDDTHRLTFEALTVRSKRASRLSTGISAVQRDTTLQASYRFSF